MFQKCFHVDDVTIQRLAEEINGVFRGGLFGVRGHQLAVERRGCGYRVIHVQVVCIFVKSGGDLFIFDNYVKLHGTMTNEKNW